jgi:uncharacterized BrkB/YihY/UPF0761 family membrane protein
VFVCLFVCLFVCFVSIVGYRQSQLLVAAVLFREFRWMAIGYWLLAIAVII